MSVLDVLSGLSTAAGKAFEGYGADEQTGVRDALAARKAQDEAERNRVLNALTQREIATPRLGDTNYATLKGQEAGAVKGAETNAETPGLVARAEKMIPVDVAKQAALAPGNVKQAVDTATGIAPITSASHERERLFDNAHQAPDKPQVSIQQPLIPGEPAKAVVVDANDPTHPKVTVTEVPGVTKGTGPGGQNAPQMAAARANLESARKTMDDFEAKLRVGGATYGPFDATKGALGSSEQTQTAKGLLGGVESLAGNVAGASLRGDNPELANYLKAKKFVAEAILNTHKRPNQTQYEIEQELSGIGPRMDNFTGPDAATQIAQSKDRRDRMFNEVFGGDGGAKSGAATKALSPDDAAHAQRDPKFAAWARAQGYAVP